MALEHGRSPWLPQRNKIQTNKKQTSKQTQTPSNRDPWPLRFDQFDRTACFSLTKAPVFCTVRNWYCFSTPILQLLMGERVRVRVRVTKLVYQTGSTTPFQAQGGKKKAAAASSKQQLNTFLPTRISPSAQTGHHPFFFW